MDLYFVHDVCLSLKIKYLNFIILRNDLLFSIDANNSSVNNVVFSIKSNNITLGCPLEDDLWSKFKNRMRIFNQFNDGMPVRVQKRNGIFNQCNDSFRDTVNRNRFYNRVNNCSFDDNDWANNSFSSFMSMKYKHECLKQNNIVFTCPKIFQGPFIQICNFLKGFAYKPVDVPSPNDAWDAALRSLQNDIAREELVENSDKGTFMSNNSYVYSSDLDSEIITSGEEIESVSNQEFWDSVEGFYLSETEWKRLGLLISKHYGSDFVGDLVFSRGDPFSCWCNKSFLRDLNLEFSDIIWEDDRVWDAVFSDFKRSLNSVIQSRTVNDALVRLNILSPMELTKYHISTEVGQDNDIGAGGFFDSSSDEELRYQEVLRYDNLIGADKEESNSILPQGLRIEDSEPVGNPGIYTDFSMGRRGVLDQALEENAYTGHVIYEAEESLVLSNLTETSIDLGVVQSVDNGNLVSQNNSVSNFEFPDDWTPAQIRAKKRILRIKEILERVTEDD